MTQVVNARDGSSQLPPPTVFFVEPEILVRMAVAEYLRECGYTVIEGAMADDVFAILRAGRHVDIVLVDVNLPGNLDGFGLARWLRDHHAGIEVILTSSVRRAAQKAGELCDDGPLEKPYDPRDLIRRINLLRARRRAQL
jgi:DNA-binding response OmpR family regulator